MDNIYNALIMAGSVLLFLVGITFAIYNYSVVFDVNDKMLTNSEKYDRTAERFQYSEYFTTTDGLNQSGDLKRIYTGAQVANTILNMYMVKKELTNPLTGEVIINPDPTTDGLLSRDISYKTIVVNGITYKRDNYQLSMFKGGGAYGTLKYILPYKFYVSDATFNGSESTVTFTKIDDL